MRSQKWNAQVVPFSRDLKNLSLRLHLLKEYVGEEKISLAYTLAREQSDSLWGLGWAGDEKRKHLKSRILCTKSIDVHRPFGSSSIGFAFNLMLIVWTLQVSSFVRESIAQSWNRRIKKSIFWEIKKLTFSMCCPGQDKKRSRQCNYYESLESKHTPPGQLKIVFER